MRELRAGQPRQKRQPKRGGGPMRELAARNCHGVAPQTEADKSFDHFTGA
jgi:hypothetical protein